MIVIRPVLETGALPGFEFWPVAEQPPHHLTPLNGTLSDEQVGTAIATMAGYNSSRVEDHLTDPADAFLSSLLHEEGFVAPGGLRVQDTGTGTTLTPGCCCGLEDWRTGADGWRSPTEASCGSATTRHLGPNNSATPSGSTRTASTRAP
ncbi:hypothetical protein [Streptomyces sp. NPDC048473]|uniref:hypothetical protein n=1 Tax=unclassified Streptomyces TaxID=2593676 RepID=UPI003722136B